MRKKIDIRPALRHQASEIATLIMEAMDHDCCQNLAGPDRTLGDFHRMMTRLVAMDDSQYSYRGTLTAMEGDTLAGILTAYDGRDLHRLRRRFIEAAREELGRDYSQMDDETGAGEYYIDSLCVKPDFRKRGIATALLREVVRRHGDQPVGLLVDHTHPWAERLYLAVGFRFVGETMWGGHAMNHLQYPVRCPWCNADPVLLPYHDTEWGVPVHDDRDHFMYLLMESMSCGLSWRMMLQRREVFRQCFAGFDAAAVAAFGDADVDRIVATEGMIRSPRKVRAIIGNARAFVRVQQEWGSFDRYIWSFTDGRTVVRPAHEQTWVTRSDLSDRVSADLKHRGFTYLGSVIVYSHLQAIGVINDHSAQCFRYRQLIHTTYSL